MSCVRLPHVPRPCSRTLHVRPSPARLYPHLSPSPRVSIAQARIVVQHRCAMFRRGHVTSLVRVRCIVQARDGCRGCWDVDKVMGEVG